jgi:hypothetical protein
MLPAPQQQWWQQFIASRQQALGQQIQQLHQTQPWQLPGYARMMNPLLTKMNVPALGESDPNAGIMPYFMGAGAQDGSMPGGQGGTVNPQLMAMLMGGTGGAL